jgi:hypothetical protein
MGGGAVLYRQGVPGFRVCLGFRVWARFTLIEGGRSSSGRPRI